MRILIYKRARIGDPDSLGRFGTDDRLGRMRLLNYDAVIGIGGTGREAQRLGIARRINWVGIQPTKRQHSDTGPILATFGEFLLLEETGPLLHELAPRLAHRMYKDRIRLLLTGYTDEEQAEAEAIVEWARRHPQTRSRSARRRSQGRS